MSFGIVLEGTTVAALSYVVPGMMVETCIGALARKIYPISQDKAIHIGDSSRDFYHPHMGVRIDKIAYEGQAWYTKIACAVAVALAGFLLGSITGFLLAVPIVIISQETEFALMAICVGTLTGIFKAIAYDPTIGLPQWSDYISKNCF